MRYRSGHLIIGLAAAAAWACTPGDDAARTPPPTPFVLDAGPALIEFKAGTLQVFGEGTGPAPWTAPAGKKRLVLTGTAAFKECTHAAPPAVGERAPKESWIGATIDTEKAALFDDRGTRYAPIAAGGGEEMQPTRASAFLVAEVACEEAMKPMPVSFFFEVPATADLSKLTFVFLGATAPIRGIPKATAAGDR
jgi:hypothetical protein